MPNPMHMAINTTPNKLDITGLDFVRWVTKPNTSDATIKRIDAVALDPFAAILLLSGAKPSKAEATMSIKEAIKKNIVNSAKIKNSCFPYFPTFFSVMATRDLPLLRTEANKEEKSCAAPKKMPPSTIHSTTGIQPKMAACTGPLMGLAPAIDEKWCPNKIPRSVGT